jgi:hypothetical protein
VLGLYLSLAKSAREPAPGAPQCPLFLIPKRAMERREAPEACEFLGATFLKVEVHSWTFISY